MSTNVIRVFASISCLLAFNTVQAAQRPTSNLCSFYGYSRLQSDSSNPSKPSWTPIPIGTLDMSQIESLKTALNSPHPQDRARAAFLVGQTNSPGCALLLKRCLNDRDRIVSIHAGIALACLGDSSGIPACAAALRHSPEWTAYYAVYGLWRINTPKSKSILAGTHTVSSKFLKDCIAAARATPHSSTTARARQTSGSAKSTTSDLWDETSSVYIREGDWWFHRGNYDQTIRSNEASIFFDPSNIDTYSSIAYLQWSMGRESQAVNTLNRAIAANPKDPDSYYQLGLHYFVAKKYNSAIRPLKASLDIKDDSIVRRTYAHCLEKVGRLKAALAQWEIIVNNNPNDGAAIKNRDKVKNILETRR